MVLMREYCVSVLHRDHLNFQIYLGRIEAVQNSSCDKAVELFVG